MSFLTPWDERERISREPHDVIAQTLTSINLHLTNLEKEALTNIARHAKASRAAVRIQKLADAICMEIKDNGKAFQAQRVLDSKQNTRLGLLGMRERLEMISDSLSIESSPRKGTFVQAQIPLSNGRWRRNVEHCPA